MPFVKRTLTDCHQNLADKIAAGVIPTSSLKLAYWTRMINEGVQYCAGRLRMVKSTSLTTVSGTIALPNDFILINKVVNSGGLSLPQISQDSSTNAGMGFWIKGNQTDGFTLNTPDDQTYTVFYTWRPGLLVNGTDVCVIPDTVAVVCYAYSKLRMAQTDPINDAAIEMAECNRRLDEILDQQQMNDQPLGFVSEGDNSSNWFASL